VALPNRVVVGRGPSFVPASLASSRVRLGEKPRLNVKGKGTGSPIEKVNS